MKSQFKNTPIALAVAAMFLSPIAFAGGNNNDGGQNGGDRNHDPVSITKDISVTQDVTTEGKVRVGGYIRIDSSSMAVVNDAQTTTENSVSNNEVTNAATVDGNALNNAKGNIGVNVTAGDNNQQANAAALSASDASFVFGSSDAEVFASQAAVGNTTNNAGQTNAATLGGDALANASGNIGVNISAGNSNQQKNDLAASVAVARMATATVQVGQVNGGNTTTNDPIHKETVVVVPVSLALSAGGVYAGFGLGGYSGTQSGTYSGTQSGSTTGSSYQANNIYPDIWPGATHPGNGPQTGHFDLDGQAQGAVLNPNGSVDANGTPVGGLSFDNTGTYSGSQSGSYRGTQSGGLGFVEAGGIALSGTVTGNVPVVVATNLATTNTSSLGGNALMNASGNIGVNIASGTNNQQYNGLAISATQAGSVTGGGSGELH